MVSHVFPYELNVKRGKEIVKAQSFLELHLKTIFSENKVNLFFLVKLIIFYLLLQFVLPENYGN